MITRRAGTDVAIGIWRHGSAPVTQIRESLARSTAVDGVAALSGHVLVALDGGSAWWLPLTGTAPPDVGPPAGTASSVPPTGTVPSVTAGADIPGPDSADALVGVAVAVGDDPAEVVVAPVARGRGHGSALVRAAVDRQGAVWAHGDLPAARAVAGSLGLRRGRVLLQLRRSLDDSSAWRAVGLPAGVRLRTFVPGQDEQAFLDVNARAFAWHPEQGRLDLPGLREEMAEDWFDPAGFFLAVADVEPGGELGRTGGRVLGFHWTKVHREDPTPGQHGDRGPVGEVYVLGVDPESGMRGLGGPLTAIGLDHLARQGLHTVMLYVEGDNERALRLYRRFGFTTQLTSAVYTSPRIEADPTVEASVSATP